VSRLRVGATTLDVEIVQEPGRARVDVTSRGPEVDLGLLLSVPLGAEDVRASASGSGDAGAARGSGGGVGAGVRGDPVAGRHDRTVTRTLHLTDGATLSSAVTWTGGLQVAAPLVDLVPGQASSGVRVVDFTEADGGWLLELEGEAGRAYDVRLFGATPVVAGVTGASAEVRTPGATLAATRADAHLLHVLFPDGSGRRLAAVRLRPGG